MNFLSKSTKRLVCGLIGVLGLLAIASRLQHQEQPVLAQTLTPSSLAQGQLLVAARQEQIVLGGSLLWQATLQSGTQLQLTRTFQKIAPSPGSKLLNVYTSAPSDVEGWWTLSAKKQGIAAPVKLWRSASFANVLETVLTACYDGRSFYFVSKWDNSPSSLGFSFVPLVSPVSLIQVDGLVESAQSLSFRATPQLRVRRLTSAYAETEGGGPHVLVGGDWQTVAGSKLRLRLRYRRGDTIAYEGRDVNWKLTKPFQPRGYVWVETTVRSLPPHDKITSTYGRWKPTPAELATQKKALARKDQMPEYRRRREVFGQTKEQARANVRRDSGIKDWQPLKEAWDTPDLKPKMYWLTPTPPPTVAPTNTPTPPVPKQAP